MNDPPRVGDLLGMSVLDADGADLGRVSDLRVAWTAGRPAPPVVTGLIVGPGRAGSMLGYDRRQEQGPALLRAIVRRRHRGSVLVPWPLVEQVEWERGRLLLRGPGTG